MHVRAPACPRFTVLFLLLLMGGHPGLSAQNAEFHGQASGWFQARENGSPLSRFGIRYVPDLFLEAAFGDEYFADAELALNAYGSADFSGRDRHVTDKDLRPYRLWARFAGSRFEARAGLQKINFGSAALFRPLRWFDTLDPRDPRGLTDGVYALLGRYYFQNNANIWLWGLYGNEDPKGWELLSTKDGGPEFGGRLQVPVSSGEAALSCHFRRADLSRPADGKLVPNSGSAGESRIGLDGKWDLGIGAWFEAGLVHRRAENTDRDFERMLTLGADYTFGVGNGIGLLAEFFHTDDAAEIFDGAEGANYAGASLSYPLGLLDEVAGIYRRDLTHGDNYLSIRWQRKYDNWALHLTAFLNPETNDPMSGTGLELMLVFNH